VRAQARGQRRPKAVAEPLLPKPAGRADCTETTEQGIVYDEEETRCLGRDRNALVYDAV